MQAVVQHAPRGLLRVLLWTLAAGVGVVLAVALGTSTASAAGSSTDRSEKPVAGLLGDVTGGATDPLTDALDPVTAPVEDAVAPVTEPLRAAVTGGGAEAPPRSADAVDRTPDRAASTSAEEDAAHDAADQAAADQPDGRDATSEHAGTSTDRQEAGERRVVPVPVDALDFGPRPFLADHHQDDGAATAPVSASAGAVALDDATTTHVSRDDLLIDVVAPRDTFHSSQNHTRPGFSPD